MLHLLLLSTASSSSSNGSNVTLPFGALIGTTLGNGVNQFLGVPYATQKRWVAAEEWSTPYTGGSRTALEYGSMCAQGGGGPDGAADLMEGSEDCLFLNIFAPPANGNANAATMVFLHGGGMTMGSGNDQNGTALAAKHGVIVVTINYRLGAFGLLPMHDDVAAKRSTGLFGYLDQRSALKWVKAHIAAFGGDASRVLLFGQSAGATSVCVHLAMRGSYGAGLFHAAAMESPYDCTRGDTLASALAQTDDFTKELKCDSSADIRTCLNGKSTAAVLIAATGSLMPQTGGTSLPHPTVDGIELLGSPYRILKQSGTPVPILVGSNTNEGTFFLHGPASLSALSSQLASLTGGNASLLARAKTLYPATGGRYFAAMAASLGHAKVNCVARRIAAAGAGSGSGGSYLYHFARFNTCSDFSPLTDGVTHTMELAYVFDQPGSSTAKCRQGFSAPDALLSSNMMAAWSSFAASGAPGATMMSPAWPKTGVNALEGYVWNTTQAVESEYLGSFCSFWDEVNDARVF